MTKGNKEKKNEWTKEPMDEWTWPETINTYWIKGKKEETKVRGIETKLTLIDLGMW